MFIYLIVNHVTGKYYIGQHKGNNLKQYLQKKLYDARVGRGGKSYLYASMRKHPKEAWSIHALLSDIQTCEELDQTEKDFIEFLRSRDHEYGYNICKGGEGFTGTHSPEARAKVTAALKERWAQPGFKEHWTELMTGHDVSEETIDKIKAKRALQDETPRIEAVRQWALDHPEEMSTRMSREVHSLGGKAGSREAKQRAARAGIESGSYIKAQHTRWHLNRGIKKLGCAFCN